MKQIDTHERDADELTKPVKAHGMDANIRMIPIGIRAPYLSHRGPLTNRRKIVPATEQMLDVHICCLVRPSVSLTSGRSGAIANQMKNAIKKQNHEQWNALMCGRLNDRSLISVALSSWLGSTLTKYSWYFLFSTGYKYDKDVM